MMSTPAILLRIGCLSKTNRPIAVADAPSAMNTSEKPRTNATERMST
jgi:hypothetical protein